MLEKLAVIVIIVATIVFTGVMLVYKPQPSPISTVEIIYVTPQPTEKPIEANAWVTCYNGAGDVIFEGSTYDTFRHTGYKFFAGQLTWYDLDGSTHTFTGGDVCHIVH